MSLDLSLQPRDGERGRLPRRFPPPAESRKLAPQVAGPLRVSKVINPVVLHRRLLDPRESISLSPLAVSNLLG